MYYPPLPMNQCRPVYTTGQIAKLLLVAPRTVSGWIDSNKLRGYRIPTSHDNQRNRADSSRGDRRVLHADLIKFMRAHRIPHFGVLDGANRLLRIGPASSEIEEMRPHLGETWTLHDADNGFDAASIYAYWNPQTVLIDLALGRMETLRMAKTLRNTPVPPRILLIAGEDESDWNDLQQTASVVLQRPFAFLHLISLLKEDTNS